MTAAAEASILITVLEAGRMRGALARGGLWAVVSGFGRKFEWFCGALPGAEENEKVRARRKLFSHLVFVWLGCCCVWAWSGLLGGEGWSSCGTTPEASHAL